MMGCERKEDKAEGSGSGCVSSCVEAGAGV